jgi:hypothetical protein
MTLKMVNDISVSLGKKTPVSVSLQQSFPSVAVERIMHSVNSTFPGSDGWPCYFFQPCSFDLASIVCHYLTALLPAE